MRKLKIIWLLSLFIFISNGVYSSTQPTKYQRKVLEIKRKYVKKILIEGGKWRSNSNLQIRNASEDELDASLFMGFLVCSHLVDNYKRELKRAERFKTKKDYQYEKELKEKKLKEKYEKTDRRIIFRNIKGKFENWNKRGEFEEKEIYLNRLKNQSHMVFDSICLDEIQNQVVKMNEYRWKKEVLPYDPENEILSITFDIEGFKWTNKYSISFKDAKIYKDFYYYSEINKKKSYWCFYNNNLCPKAIRLEEPNHTDNNTLCDALVENTENIIYTFDKFEIQNQYLIGYTFDYIKVIKKQEKERLEKKKKEEERKELEKLKRKQRRILEEHRKLKKQEEERLEKKKKEKEKKELDELKKKLKNTIIIKTL